ncbi:hypothetical protein [Candidatus Uabimicrobium sp. HlEnr_7]|uniref:hypothetical protein n=1 Tax=Candidatus Uabimicrobium helgolandensis TaxID=3095367 RepID=UPI00355655BC
MWAKEFPKSLPLESYKSKFDLRQDVPSWFIEGVLDESPQKLTEFLFAIKVTSDLETKKYFSPAR